MSKIRRRLDLQAKIVLVLIAVIVPVFLVVTIIENQITRPLLEEEMKQIGITTAKNLAADIVSQRLMTAVDRESRMETLVQEILYFQPNIVRMDVVVKEPISGLQKIVASNIEEDPSTTSQELYSEVQRSEYHRDEQVGGTWEILVPIEQKGRDFKTPHKILGTVHVIVSMKFVHRVVRTLWNITATAAGVSVVLLLLVLSYFLRKTINSDRLLKRAESENLVLTEQLRDAERQLMNTEKLAVMGQLTASFAHEIGTPLNAIGGHLQLLREEVGDRKVDERLDIVNGQLGKIEGIVKGFLQSTAKPTSQRQLVDINRLAEQTLAIVSPRLESLGIEVLRDFDRAIGPVRAVPIELEQILLNLVNNAIDSLKHKSKRQPKARLQMRLSTEADQVGAQSWAVVSVYDTGDGIKKSDLPNVLKPFFTTKSPGEGTGLGLTICQELARKHGGMLKLESKEGAWAKVILRIPYQNET